MDTPYQNRFDNLRFTNRSLLSILLPILMVIPAATHAGAQITISPTRIVFEGRARSASVNLINRGNETSTFRIKFERKRMTEDGQFALIESPLPGENFSDQMIRFSPRQVVLPPGKSQVVRLLLRKPPNLKDGEYRSHLLFAEVPREAGKSIEAQGGKPKQLSISIKPILGISIPVIVRHGDTGAEIRFSKYQLTNLSPDKSKAELNLIMKRGGNASVYGDIQVTYKKDKNSKNGTVVAQVNGIAVYSPNTERTVKLALQTPKGIKLDGGYLDISYRESPAAGDKILAQGQFAISGAR